MTTSQLYVSKEGPSTEGNCLSSPLICSHQYHSDDDNNDDDADADVVAGGNDDDADVVDGGDDDDADLVGGSDDDNADVVDGGDNPHLSHVLLWYTATRHHVQFW